MPLHIACLRGHIGVAELLLMFGANVDVKHLQVIMFATCSCAMLSIHKMLYYFL